MKPHHFAIGFLLVLCGSCVTAVQVPDSAPDGCLHDHPNAFEIGLSSVDTVLSDSYLAQRGILEVNLSSSILRDSGGGIGCIVGNRQFQFDNPPQQGAIFSSGWSVCRNGTLALGGSTCFFSCPAGSFQNIYDRRIDVNCAIVEMVMITDNTLPPLSEFVDGQVRATGSLTAPSTTAASEPASTHTAAAPTTTLVPWLSTTSSARDPSVFAATSHGAQQPDVRVQGQKPPLWGPMDKAP